MLQTSPQLAKNSHLGFELPKPALRQCSRPTNFNLASGIAACLRWEDGGPRCTAKERDSEAGLDYFGARYLSSAQGRFTSIDPGRDLHLADPQSWNLYSYTRNRPLISIDPDGGFVFTLFGTVTGALSGGISAYVNDTDVRAGIASGALAGAAAGAVTDLTIATGGGALVVIGGAAGSAATQFAEGAKNIDLQQVGVQAAIGGAIGGLTGAAEVIGQKATVTVQHFTSDEKLQLISASKELFAGTHVTKPGQGPLVSTPAQAELRLGIDVGKGANNITLTTTRGNLLIPAGGKTTRGGAYQRQLKEAVRIDPKKFRRTPEQEP